MHTPARFAVLDRCPGVAIRFEARPGGFLELVHHMADLRIARVVLRCPGDDARRVLVLELKRVSHGGHLVRMAPQHFDFLVFGSFDSGCDPLPDPHGERGRLHPHAPANARELAELQDENARFRAEAMNREDE